MLKIVRVYIALFLAVLGFNAAAVGPDFTTLTAGVDFSTVGPAILAVAALIGLVLVVRKGAKMILGMIK